MLAASAFLAGSTAASHGAGVVKSRRGPFAFQYAPSLTPDQLDWYSRFAVLVTHDPLPREQVAALHAAGTKLLFYEWSVAFYESRATAWQRSLLRGTKRTLLHDAPLRGGVGSSTADAWYFDPADARHANDRAAELVRRLAETGYDGVFFDTTRWESVHPDARREFERRHPGRSYDAAFSDFLCTLRLEHPLIFTNQGYRDAERYLPHTDWDLTESLITRPVERKAQLRAWSDPRDPWNSIHFVLKTMIEPLTARYPGVRLAHLNYIDAPSAEAIRATVAAAQLFDSEAFVAAQSPGHEQNAIYFRDPGTAIAPRVDWPDQGGAHRFYTNGLIAVSAASSAYTIALHGRRLRNHVTGELVCGEHLVIPPTVKGPRAWFFDDTQDCAGEDPVEGPR